jgi:hypothetical protein
MLNKYGTGPHRTYLGAYSVSMKFDLRLLWSALGMGAYCQRQKKERPGSKERGR